MLQLCQQRHDCSAVQGCLSSSVSHSHTVCYILISLTGMHYPSLSCRKGIKLNIQEYAKTPVTYFLWEKKAQYTIQLTGESNTIHSPLPFSGHTSGNSKADKDFSWRTRSTELRESCGIQEILWYQLVLLNDFIGFKFHEEEGKKKKAEVYRAICR